jgi:hypothetical protein
MPILLDRRNPGYDAGGGESRIFDAGLDACSTRASWQTTRTDGLPYDTGKNCVFHERDFPLT